LQSTKIKMVDQDELVHKRQKLLDFLKWYYQKIGSIVKKYSFLKIRIDENKDKEDADKILDRI
jgi:hypothetical protein